MLHKYIINSSDIDASGLWSHRDTAFVVCTSRLCTSLYHMHSPSSLPAGRSIPITENKAFPAAGRNGPLYLNATKKGQRYKGIKIT